MAESDCLHNRQWNYPVPQSALTGGVLQGQSGSTALSSHRPSFDLEEISELNLLLWSCPSIFNCNMAWRKSCFLLIQICRSLLPGDFDPFPRPSTDQWKISSHFKFQHNVVRCIREGFFTKCYFSWANTRVIEYIRNHNFYVIFKNLFERLRVTRKLKLTDILLPLFLSAA